MANNLDIIEVRTHLCIAFVAENGVSRLIEGPIMSNSEAEPRPL